MAPSVLQEEAEIKQDDLVYSIGEEDSWVSQEMGSWGDLVELSGELWRALGERGGLLGGQGSKRKDD